ncbi:MAG: type II TA system antitoxin MqsA family protein, partial [Pseudomonadota bacterium]
MQCPACGYPEMEEQNRDETLSYTHRSVTVKNLKGHFCPKCGEGIWDAESNARLDEAQTELIEGVRNEVGAEVQRIRKVLKLTQAQLAADLGLGKLAFSRYEQGKTQPAVVLVKLLKLLEKHPGLLEELRQTDIPPKRVST